LSPSLPDVCDNIGYHKSRKIREQRVRKLPFIGKSI
jgi:hypothetical protein